ncbi:uncharacterized protein TNCV_373791 [Trichonephila clavipes]|nr:uncharacterized protein TNCV_373791 [Trichonephila clavipes]
MEVEGMKTIFKRSLLERNAKYVKYIGDGDTKTFPELQNTVSYNLEKIECVGHIQKRMGARLPRLKLNHPHPKLLKKCLGGKTQNSNEIFNSTVWKYCPKTSGSSKRIVDVAVNEAVLLYNDGMAGRLDIMKHLGCKLGHFSVTYAFQSDNARIKEAEMKSRSSTLDARRALRMRRKAVHEHFVEIEGVTFNILKDNEGRRKQHSKSFMALREPRVLTWGNRKNRGEISLEPKKCLFASLYFKSLQKSQRIRERNTEFHYAFKEGKDAQGNLTASCKRLMSWFLLYKETELGRKIVPVLPPKF